MTSLYDKTPRGVETAGVNQPCTTHLNRSRSMRDVFRSVEVRKLRLALSSPKPRPKGRPAGWKPALIAFAGGDAAE